MSNLDLSFFSLFLTSFHEGIQGTIRNFKKIQVNVIKSHLSLQYNFKKNTLWKIKSISHSNDEFWSPLTLLKHFFVTVRTFGTIQP